MKASLIIKNGNVLTMDEREKRAGWVAVSKDRIIGTGSGDGFKELVSPDTRIIDAEGNTVVPGFIDSHFHLVITALGARWVNLEEAEDFDTVGEMLRKAAEENPDRPVVGSRLEWQYLKERRMPDRYDLNRYCRDVPVAVYSADYQMLSVNTCGLLHFKIPFALEGIHTDENGIPTGVFSGKAGARLDGEIQKSFDDDFINDAVERIVPDLVGYGLTTVAAMEGGKMNAEFYRDRDSEYVYGNSERLPIGTELFYPTADISYVLEKGLGRIGGALYVDGTIGARTAALFEPYSDKSDTSGILIFNPSELREFTSRCYGLDLQIAYDAIGDAGIEASLDALEYAAKLHGKKDLRCRIEHCEMMTEAQMKRAVELSAIASVQPAYEGLWGGKGRMYETRLGERYKKTNRFREMIDSGLIVCGGSDSDVTEPNPLLGIHWAVNHPVECHRVTVEEAVRMYTYNGAYALFKEDEIGSITCGKKADIAVLDADIENMDKSKIKDVKVAFTVKDGEILYERE